MMKVDEEDEEWRVVVQPCQNAEEKTCVFIITGEVDGEVDHQGVHRRGRVVRFR